MDRAFVHVTPSFRRHKREVLAALAAAFLIVAVGCQRGIEENGGKGMANERTVTMKGKPMRLNGSEVKVGDTAPDFVAVENDLSTFQFSSLRGKKVCIIACVPSLDTGVCDRETHKFNEEAGALAPEVQILTISMDLPFAQKRWCEAGSVKNLKTLSDHRDASFALAYGVLLKDLRLEARAIFVVDKAGKVQYVQLVPEIAQEPDYEAAIAAAKKLR